MAHDNLAMSPVYGYYEQTRIYAESSSPVYGYYEQTWIYAESSSLVYGYYEQTWIYAVTRPEGYSVIGCATD